MEENPGVGTPDDSSPSESQGEGGQINQVAIFGGGENLQGKIKKKKKQKKKNRTYEYLLTKKNLIAKIEKRIDDSEKIPKTLKRQYKAIELDPLKLIVTNFPFDCTPEEITQFYTSLLSELDPRFEQKRIKPIADCDLGATRRFAVLSCLDQSVVHKMLALDNTGFNGVSFKIQRPKNFFARHFENGNFQWDENGNLTNLDQEEECRLYLGNLPQYLKEDEIRKIVQTFGPLKSFQLKVEATPSGELVSKGYCLFEYQNSADAERALKELNNKHLGDKILRIEKLVSAGPSDRGKPKVALTKEAQTSFLLMFPKLRDPLVQGMLCIPNTCIVASRVIQLLNLFGPEDLLEEEFFRGVSEDVKFECQKFGNVLAIEIPRPDLDSGYCCPSVGKVFVHFSIEKEAKEARYRLNGRSYNRRTVVASFYPEDKFAKKSYLTSL